MDPRHEKELARIGAESRSMINETRKTCAEARTHVADSRALVERSLDLLRRRFLRLDG